MRPGLMHSSEPPTDHRTHLAASLENQSRSDRCSIGLLRTKGGNLNELVVDLKANGMGQ